MISVEFANRQKQPVDSRPLIDAVELVLQGEGIDAAQISLAIVTDEEIHQINRQFLQHDEPTDVISFVLDETEEGLIGEIVVSFDTAARVACEFGWTTNAELLLYVIHGTLHLTGYDDLDSMARAEMRDRERHYLAGFGLSPRYESFGDEHGK